MAVGQNRVTPKWLALASGNMDQNLRSDSWWFIWTHTKILFFKDMWNSWGKNNTPILQPPSFRALVS